MSSWLQSGRQLLPPFFMKTIQINFRIFSPPVSVIDPLVFHKKIILICLNIDLIQLSTKTFQKDENEKKRKGKKKKIIS
jgi:hypothetical protein